MSTCTFAKTLIIVTICIERFCKYLKITTKRAYLLTYAVAGSTNILIECSTIVQTDLYAVLSISLVS